MMPKRISFLLFIVLIISFLNVNAQDIYEPNKVKVDQIVIDGVLSPGEWENATEVIIDFEVNPGNNIPAKSETKGYISYSDTYLFIAFYAKGDPNNIRASVRSRDDFGMIGDDFVLVRFDTYADGRNNFLLLSNPFGSQLDARATNALTDEERYDVSFNLDYKTEGKIVEDGYQVEFKIPFSSIPFPSGKNQTWNFNLTRQYFKDGNTIDTRSQPFDRTNTCQVCQTTDLLILKDIVFEGRIELLPFIAGSQSGERFKRNGVLKYNKFKPNAGLGLNLDLNKNSSLELTLNPDFSQVEADVSQIDINSSYALEYPERRPFFNRGTDIVKFTSGAFYSRSINNPLVSSKLLSQGKKSRIYFLSALDQNSPYQIAGEDRSYFGQGGRSLINVFRYQRLINKNTRLGLISTNRYYNGGGYGNLIGTDGWFLFAKNWRLTYEILGNFNKEPQANWIDSDDQISERSVRLNEDRYKGSALYLQLYRNTKNWKSYLFLRNISPEYQANVGFVVKNNRRWLTLYHEYQNFFNKRGLQFFNLGTKADINYTFDNNLKNISLDGIFSIKTYFNTELSYTYDWDIFKNYLGVNYKYLGKSELNFKTSPNELFSLTLRMTFGKDLAYNEQIPEVGKEFTLYAMPMLQLGNKVNISPSIRYARLKNLENNLDYFNGYISRFSVRYQFNNFLNIRLVSEYNAFTERFFVQPLIQWNPNPSTVFYVGGNQNSIEDFNDEFYSPFRIDKTQFFLKFQYLIGL